MEVVNNGIKALILVRFSVLKKTIINPFWYYYLLKMALLLS